MSISDADRFLFEQDLRQLKERSAQQDREMFRLLDEQKRLLTHKPDGRSLVKAMEDTKPAQIIKAPSVEQHVAAAKAVPARPQSRSRVLLLLN